MNGFPPNPYYACHPPYDIYIDSSPLLTVQINYGQREQKNIMIANMILNAPCISTFIISIYVKYTNRILIVILDT